MKKVIGYGPKSEYFPSFPVILLLEEDGEKWVYRHSSIGPELNNKITDSDLSLFIDRFTIFEKPKDYRENHWLAIESNGVTWFLAEEGSSWRREKANDLLNQGSILIETDPVQALKILDIAGKLAGTNLEELISQLESKRIDEKESLESIYQRTEYKR